MTKSELKNTIDQSFTEIDQIKIGVKHPDPKKSNLTATKVYDVVPMEGLSNINFVEYLFQNDPNKDFKAYDKYLLPSHFLLEKNQENTENKNNLEDIYCLYKNNKLISFNNDENNKKDKAEYFSYDRDFISTKLNETDSFNRYFMILDKKNNKLKISPIKGKYTLRNYNKFEESEEQSKDDDNENNDKNLLKNKRKRDIILEPNFFPLPSL